MMSNRSRSSMCDTSHSSRSEGVTRPIAPLLRDTNGAFVSGRVALRFGADRGNNKGLTEPSVKGANTASAGTKAKLPEVVSADHLAAMWKTELDAERRQLLDHMIDGHALARSECASFRFGVGVEPDVHAAPL